MAESAIDAATGRFEPVRYSTAKGHFVLAATVAGSGMAFIDSTVVNIALPAIGKDFHASVADLQWLVTAYLLTLSGLILLGGALGDHFGRRKIFVIGVVAFAAASMVCGIAPDTGALIAARAAQGVGGALLTPGSLAIIQAVFAEEDRSRAIGAWSGLGVIAAAVGPFLGGYLIDAVSWRLIFFINAPIAIAVVVLAQRHVPETRNPRAEGRVDLTGAVTGTVGLGGVTYALIEGPSVGWASPSELVALLGGLVVLASFVVVERRSQNPLVPLSIFSSRQFSAANFATFFIYGAFGGAFFLAPVELEQVLHFTPLDAGAALLPASFVLFVLSARFGALSAKYGPRLFMGFGPIIAGGGLALFARIGAQASYQADVLPGILVFGLGLGVTVAPLTATVLAAAPNENTGVASAVNNAVARSASLIAVAILPAAAGIGGESYLKPMLFNSGFRNAVLIAGAACAAGGLLALAMIRNPRRDLPRAAPRTCVAPAVYQGLCVPGALRQGPRTPASAQ
ncbi:MAG: DHA2 family efflux MFS transporter permease subunit [Acidimicrobiales bacterium]